MAEFSDVATADNLQQPAALELGNFSSVSLDTDLQIKQKKQPRRILHFSDGTLEEYSTDDEEDQRDSNEEPEVNPKSLNWPNWFAHMGMKGGESVLGTIDYLGEGLANVFGITSQKYFYEVQEYKRALAEEEKEKLEEKEQMAGWNSGTPQLFEKESGIGEPIHQTTSKSTEIAKSEAIIEENETIDTKKY